MDPTLIALLAVSGGISLAALKICANIWIRKKELESGNTPHDDVRRAINGIRDELAQLRATQEGQVGELYERLEFAERVLIQQREARGIEPSEITPM